MEMDQSIERSVLPIRIGSGDGIEFKGTGFIIYTSQDATYIITCLHVIKGFEEGKQITVNNYDAELFDSGENFGLDLAILKIPKRLDGDQGNQRCALNLCKSGNKETGILISGWKKNIKVYGEQEEVQRDIEGKLGSEIFFSSGKTKNISIPGWDLVINEGRHLLEHGYSGSPVIGNKSNCVLGIASSREGSGETGQAIAVENIKFLTKFCDEFGNELVGGFSPKEPIKNLSPHLGDVTKAIANGKLIPFLGSGINLCDRQEKLNPRDWNPSGSYPPTRSELAIYLEKEILGTILTGVQCPLCDPTRKSLPEGCPIEGDISLTRLLFQYVSQGLEIRMSSVDLKNALNKICKHDYAPNLLHRFLAELPRTLRQKGYENPILIVTANFDRTLEGALKKEKQPFDLVSYVDSKKCFLHQKFRKDDQDQKEIEIVSKYEQLITDPNEYSEIEFDAYPVILKLYDLVEGANYQEENFVITEDHFIDYLAQRPIGQMIPASILGKLKQNHIWFLGYGLSNWDERVPLRRIWDKKEHSRWWAVQSNPTALDESLWRKNHVNLISMSLDDYVTNLDQLLEQLQPK